jgi:hypothetical protein
MTECTQSGFGFEDCGSRKIVARFDGGTISSDGGVDGGIKEQHFWRF